MINIVIIDDEMSRLATILNWIKYNIQVDDEFGVTHSPEFRESLVLGADVVFLDHDLGGVDVYDELKKIDFSQRDPNTINFIVHSMNPVGAKNIMNLLLDEGFRATRVPLSNM